MPLAAGDADPPRDKGGAGHPAGPRLLCGQPPATRHQRRIGRGVPALPEPVDGAVPLLVSEFVARAQDDQKRSLDGQRVRRRRYPPPGSWSRAAGSPSRSPRKPALPPSRRCCSPTRSPPSIHQPTATRTPSSRTSHSSAVLGCATTYGAGQLQRAAVPGGRPCQPFWAVASAAAHPSLTVAYQTRSAASTRVSLTRDKRRYSSRRPMTSRRSSTASSAEAASR